MARVLKRNFYERDTVTVARELLGQTLCRRLDSGKILCASITETEAYDGFDDRASHAHKGVTVRNKVMFGPSGRAYVYLCYGVHWLLNVTTREAGYPAAVLIRGVEGVAGPGRLTKHFQVDKRFNEVPLTRVAGLWVEAADVLPDESDVSATPRVGVDYAGETWAAMPWRFVWESIRRTRVKCPQGACSPRACITGTHECK